MEFIVLSKTMKIIQLEAFKQPHQKVQIQLVPKFVFLIFMRKKKK